MLVTEAEAKTKWCPFVRVALIGGSGSVNRYPDPQTLHPEDRCLASGCMMWQSEPNHSRMPPNELPGSCGLAK